MEKKKLLAAAQPPVPPAPARRPCVKFLHGSALRDDYAWLRAENWEEVLRDPGALPGEIRAAIEAENLYAQAALAPLSALKRELVAEMRARIHGEDSGVPIKDGPWLYNSRFREGGQYPIFCREPLEGGPEQMLLDGDAEAEGKSFFEIGSASHSPDHAKLAWSADDTGSELYAIRIRDLGQGGDSGAQQRQIVSDTGGEIVWMADSLGFYYVWMDENHRPAEVRRHRIGAGPAADACVYRSDNPGLFIHIRRSQSGAYGIIKIEDHDSSECRLIDLGNPNSEPSLVAPRMPGVRYDVEPHGSELFIRTNADGAEDFKIVTAPLENAPQRCWVEAVPHRPGRMIINMAVYPDYLVRIERENGLPQIVIRQLATGDEHTIAFEGEAYSLGLEERLEYDSEILRFTYSSLAVPWETYDYNLKTRERLLRKRQIIPSGHDPARYVTKRLFARATDGAEIPISILHRRDLQFNGKAPPLLLYGYGAYGSHVPASFSTHRLSLVDRGFIFAIAHVRGGTDKGWRWYTDGKLAKKPNSFTDFNAAARHLIEAGYTGEGRIIAEGGSAGGMLVAAALNLSPELFAGVIADVPFVDVLNTMLDPSLPLTPPEWLEWGNPISDRDAFELIRSYSPYDNVKPGEYPPVLALASLSDPRVTYWEPLKWVAKLRSAAAGGPFLLCTNMEAGHAGAPGRFDHLEEIALKYAFAIACAEGLFRKSR